VKPLVSILIPAFNAQRWIAETIQSALGQTWPRKEIIIVDDGSSDHTLAVTKAFECNNIKVVTQQNAGAAAARNRAFAECQGDYVQWLDADDLLGPDKIERQLLHPRSCDPTVLLSSSWAHFRSSISRANFRPTCLWSDLSPTEWLLRKLETNHFMQTATWLVSRELTQKAGPWNSRLLGDDDGEYFCRVLRGSTATCFVPESKVYYRRSPSSLSYIGNSPAKLEAQFRSMEMHIGYLCAMDNSERARAACIHHLQTYLPLFYPERMDIVARAEAIAGSLGGKLAPARLSWKYAWMQHVFGWKFAKRAQQFYNQAKSSVLRYLDERVAN
jgi:glycosyltransferase involved in cell wall biosynthesis